MAHSDAGQDFTIVTPFDLDRPHERERAFALVPRFMARKLATALVFSGEAWLGPERTRSGEEAVIAIGVGTVVRAQSPERPANT